MSSTPLPPIDNAIGQLRAEIIAQDWQLSPQRIARLRDALASLRIFFASHSHALALLKMAISVVDHIEKQGSQAKALDFLKENLAHIVSIYEDDTNNADHAREIVSRAYKRFRRLDISLSTDSNPVPDLGQNVLALLNKLEALANEAAHLPQLLAQSGNLDPEERKRAATLLGKISSAINIVWAQLPSPPK